MLYLYIATSIGTAIPTTTANGDAATWLALLVRSIHAGSLHRFATELARESCNAVSDRDPGTRASLVLRSIISRYIAKTVPGLNRGDLTAGPSAVSRRLGSDRCDLVRRSPPHGTTASA
jgi:hypothetical protein